MRRYSRHQKLKICSSAVVLPARKRLLKHGNAIGEPVETWTRVNLLLDLLRDRNAHDCFAGSCPARGNRLATSTASAAGDSWPWPKAKASNAAHHLILCGTPIADWTLSTTIIKTAPAGGALLLGLHCGGGVCYDTTRAEHDRLGSVGISMARQSKSPARLLLQGASSGSLLRRAIAGCFAVSALATLTLPMSLRTRSRTAGMSSRNEGGSGSGPRISSAVS